MSDSSRTLQNGMIYFSCAICKADARSEVLIVLHSFILAWYLNYIKLYIIAQIIFRAKVYIMTTGMTIALHMLAYHCTLFIMYASLCNKDRAK